VVAKEGDAEIANPASQYCIDQGGTMVIQRGDGHEAKSTAGSCFNRGLKSPLFIGENVRCPGSETSLDMGQQFDRISRWKEQGNG